MARGALMLCSVQLSGPNGVITAGEHSRLAALRPRDIADGGRHTVRIVYYKYINYDYLDYFTASTFLQQFLKDNGEVRVFCGNRLSNGVSFCFLLTCTGVSWIRAGVSARFLCFWTTW
jgi:hypothetical protein